MLAYRWTKNLKEMVGSNNILNNKVIHKTPLIKTVKFCKPCNTRNSLCCNHLKSTNSLTSFVTNNTYEIYHESNCISRNIIYLLECTRCSKRHVSKSEWPFNSRLNNYRHRIKSTDYDKLLPVQQHFRLANHDFSRDAKFTIMEKIKENVSDEITVVLESREDNWILRLKTRSPNGLNSKLNHPENIRL